MTDGVRRLIREVHRRSLWQVLGIYLAGSWLALQVVDAVSRNAGLPGWVPTFALVLLVIGLPIVLATAVVQEGGPARAPEPGAAATPAPAEAASPEAPQRPEGFIERHLTWNRAILGGVLAFALLGVTVTGYFVTRWAGIGPAATLVAQGVLERGDPIVLAEFRNSSSDPLLGSMVTEALRVDLSATEAVTLLPEGTLREILQLMQHGAGEPLDAEAAREVAARAGVKAVLEGEVGSVGTGYLIVASLRDPGTGQALASFRRTAQGPDDLITAIDLLSRDIREKAGESLRAVRSGPALATVTTGSLEALRLFTEGSALIDQGRAQQGISLLRRAVELDPDFAMAWRKIAVETSNQGGDPRDIREAATRAYQARARLTERERLLAVAYFHASVTGDGDAEIEAYEGILLRWPDEPISMNNLSIRFSERTRFEEALSLLDRAVALPEPSPSARINRARTLAALGRFDEAREQVDESERLYPDRPEWNALDRWSVELAAGNLTAAEAASRALLASPGAASAGSWRTLGRGMQAVELAAVGRVEEGASRVLDEASDARRDGRLSDLYESVQVLGMFEVTIPTPAGRARAAELLAAGGPLEALPPEVRPYPEWAVLAARLGMADRARAFLAEWEVAQGPVADRLLARVRREVEALTEPDPATRADLLVRYRTETNCPRCLQLATAEAAFEAGRMEQAAALFEEALRTGAVWTGSDMVLVGLRRGPVHERLGEIFEALDRPAEAARHYAAFAELWANADAEFQPRVSHARERARVLGAR